MANSHTACLYGDYVVIELVEMTDAVAMDINSVLQKKIRICNGLRENKSEIAHPWAIACIYTPQAV